MMRFLRAVAIKSEKIPNDEGDIIDAMDGTLQ